MWAKPGLRDALSCHIATKRFYLLLESRFSQKTFPSGPTVAVTENMFKSWNLMLHSEGKFNSGNKFLINGSWECWGEICFAMENFLFFRPNERSTLRFVINEKQKKT